MIETILERYHDNPAAVIQALQDTQKAYGYLSKDHLQAISQRVGVPYSYTYSIATFYKSFSLQERGKYILKVCDGTACHLKLSEDILDELQHALGIKLGETTQDRLFTLESVNCLGACAMAPVISINEVLHGKLTRQKVRTLITQLREEEREKHKQETSLKEESSAADIAEQPVAPEKLATGVVESALHTVKKAVDKLGEIIDHVLEGK
ncbi:NADH dehydrogenase (Ubiquinone) 24 kDa subunit [Candidatus Vecturithrix granuli]|uniref:NADH dehydrogenase (Ubiquinone) 24 kDa subunit n=1 Tax=Vecturithrix granuli TaxID=1499967 RepID=A0A081C2J7_VECG1|nr:NADH dehydrogenase (Ubiquinone) 24 kDa subunit [Candidatus Vecturithrix granuli]